MRSAFFRTMATCCFSILMLQVVAMCSPVAASIQSDDCSIAKENLRRELSKIRDTPISDLDLDDVLQRLEQIVVSCPNLADAWYFRSLVEKKLGKSFNYALGKARQLKSEALRDNIDPFSGNTANDNTVRPSASSNKETNKPKIVIHSPPVTRGQSAQVKTCNVTVEGQAIDDSAIREVLVHNIRANVGEQGKFSASLNLKSGDNSILVVATDVHDNTAQERLTIACESVVAATLTSNSQPISSGRYYAVLIGVQDYQHPKVNDLDYPVGDAQKVRDVLMRHYTFASEDVQLLENPERKTILSTLSELVNKLKPEDHLLIFYAGHGHWDEERGQGYWLPSNAEPENNSDWISNSDLRDSIRAIKTGHTLLISDACFSGGLFVTREAFAKTPAIEEMLNLKSRTAMTSGAMTTVPDRSVFVKYLLEYLEKNTDSYLLASDLFNRIRTPIINNSPKQSDGKRATPRYGFVEGADDRGGDFVFVRRQSEKKPVK